MIRKTIKGPQGAELILDESQVFPDDPGAGTPAVVKYRNRYGTYWCCVGEGECDGVELPEEILNWLRSETIEQEIETLGA